MIETSFWEENIFSFQAYNTLGSTGAKNTQDTHLS